MRIALHQWLTLQSVASDFIVLVELLRLEHQLIDLFIIEFINLIFNLGGDLLIHDNRWLLDLLCLLIHESAILIFFLSSLPINLLVSIYTNHWVSVLAPVILDDRLIIKVILQMPWVQFMFIDRVYS